MFNLYVFLHRCGIALDAYIATLSDELAGGPLEQPLLLVNSALDFQGPTSVKMMLKLVKPPNEHGIAIFIIKY